MNKSIMIAEFFIAKAEVDGIEITNLKLQELLYCSQGMVLAKIGESLFEEDIIVGDYGPEVPSVQKILNRYTYNPIAVEKPMEKMRRINELDKRIEEILNKIWIMFGELNVWELNEMIFQEEPWRKAVERRVKIIDNDDLQRCFKFYLKKDDL